MSVTAKNHPISKTPCKDAQDWQSCSGPVTSKLGTRCVPPVANLDTSPQG